MIGRTSWKIMLEWSGLNLFEVTLTLDQDFTNFIVRTVQSLLLR